MVKNGKLIPIRDEFEKMFDPSSSKEAKSDEKHIEEVDGVMMIKSPCFHKIRTQEIADEESCSLKVRDESGNVYMLKMFKDSKIIDVVIEIRKIVRTEFKIMSNYPRRSYDEMEEQNLEELGFYPNVNLHLQK